MQELILDKGLGNLAAISPPSRKPGLQGHSGSCLRLTFSEQVGRDDHRPYPTRPLFATEPPVEGLWQHLKKTGLANRPTLWMEELMERACRYIQSLSPVERLRKAGVLSDNFGLST
jgi:hypothetical protein